MQILAAYYIIACAADGYAIALAVNGLVGTVVGVVMAALPAFVISPVSTFRKVTLWILPLALAGATAFAVHHLAHEYPNDPAARWGAIAAVLVAAALVAALAGLPTALIQVFALRQDVARLTRISEVERQLNAYSLLGLKLLEPTATDSWFADYQEWIDAGVALIEEIADHAEAETFRLMPMPARGDSKKQLRSRLAYIREGLVPKVRAGYWSDSS